MTSTQDRQTVLSLIDAATAERARSAPAADALGISARTLRRWRKQRGGDCRPQANRPRPAHALSETEEPEILKVCNSPEFASMPPGQIVPALADQGRYLASERTFYRVLHRHKQAIHRGRARALPQRKPPSTHTAKRPRQVWVWDITWLPGPVRGMFYRLYILMDLFSRKIIAWEVWETENAENSQCLLHRAALSENIAVLNGDNGSPLKAGTVLALMHTLEIQPSHSRPRVSNDNAHAEAFFRTAKYHPSINSDGFSTIDDARAWAGNLISLYNEEHLHSSIGWMTPSQKHEGLDLEILAQRRTVYESARSLNPKRWIRGSVRAWEPVTSTTLNPQPSTPHPPTVSKKNLKDPHDSQRTTTLTATDPELLLPKQ